MKVKNYANNHIHKPTALYWYFLFVFCLLSFVLYFSCSKTPFSSEGITVYGRVVLEDTTDYSGVKVSLYKPVELDTALVRINQEYPNIGVQISQETEFDHREHTPVYTTTTDKNGNWKIEGVEPGTYNVVAEKEGWGWQYVLDKRNFKKDYSLKLINLYKIIEISGILSKDIYLKKNQHLHVKGNVYIQADVIVDVKEGGWIILDENSEVIVKGNFSLEGSKENPIRIFSRNNTVFWQSILFKDLESVRISNVIIKNSKLGIKIKNLMKYGYVEKCYLKNNNRGFSFDGLKNLNISNIVSFNNGEFGLINDVDSLLFLNSIFYDNESCLDLENVTGSISNNIFLMNDVAIRVTFSDMRISNSDFLLNNKALNTFGGKFYYLEYNNFEKNYFCIVSNYVQLTGSAIFKLHKNNFIKTFDYVFYQSEGSIKDTINAINNWWDSIKYDDIDRKIIDCKDNFILKCLKYIPIELNVVNEAGVKN